MEEKGFKIGLDLGREKSLDNHRTDIKAASSHQGGTRLISEEDLASLGMENHQEMRSHSDTIGSSPSSKEEGTGSLLGFFGCLALLVAFVFVLQNTGNKDLSSSSSSNGADSFSRHSIRKEYLNSENSSYVASAKEVQFETTYEKAMSLIPDFAVEEKRHLLERLPRKVSLQH